MWKVLIVLVWLAIPLSAIALYRADRQRYQRDCQAQRQECVTRAGVLQRYANYFARQGQQVANLDSRTAGRAWDREWVRLQNALEVERQGLRAVPPVYYPSADAALLQAEQALADQQQAIEQGELQRKTALELAEGFADYGDAINQGRAAAYYWGRVGNRDVYLQLQEEIAKAEAAFESEKENFNYFMDESAASLAAADKLRSGVLGTVSRLPEVLKRDEQYTYEEDLRQRFARFDLGRELGALLSDLV